MFVKGTSAVSTFDFVKSQYSDQLDEWISSLPDESKEIFTDTILATNWYPMQAGLIVPTKHVAKLFYSGDAEKASFEIGQFSAKKGLSGVYSLFVKIAKPSFVLKRSPQIFSTYYKNSSFEIIEDGSNFANFKITGFKKQDELIIKRIEGWIEKVLEIVGEKKYSVISEVEDHDDKIIAYIDAEW